MRHWGRVPHRGALRREPRGPQDARGRRAARGDRLDRTDGRHLAACERPRPADDGRGALHRAGSTSYFGGPTWAEVPELAWLMFRQEATAEPEEDLDAARRAARDQIEAQLTADPHWTYNRWASGQIFDIRRRFFRREAADARRGQPLLRGIGRVGRYGRRRNVRRGAARGHGRLDHLPCGGRGRNGCVLMANASICWPDVLALCRDVLARSPTSCSTNTV